MQPAAIERWPVQCIPSDKSEPIFQRRLACPDLQ